MWRMSFSTDKSQVVTFSKATKGGKAPVDRFRVDENFHLSGFLMDKATHYTYLGLTLHQHGRFEDHASSLRAKVTKVTNFARHILSSRHSPHLAHVLTNATIRATFSYALPF
jgi:hypothetical protein